MTGTLARLEVSGALIRAARAGRGDAEAFIRLLDADLSIGGNITVLVAPQEEVEQRALGLVRAHALRALDAWHLAAASIVVPPIAGPGRRMAFASRDREQAEVAATLGFDVM